MKLTMIWRCPQCRGSLIEEQDAVHCSDCETSYECIVGIPDLRLPGASWIDYAADRAAARRVVAETKGMSVQDMVRFVYASRPDWTEERINLRTRQVMEAPERRRRDLKGWLNECTRGVGLFVDLGCGPGMLLAGAAKEGISGIGIDVSMEWLVVAQRLIAEAGGQPILAAALAEAMPLPDESVSGLISLDVIEHVADPSTYLTEINRVLQPEGRIALATPNRFSLSPEPHVAVWGVGWLPRSKQKAFVKWRSGKSYDYVRLLSAEEIKSLFHAHTHITPRFEIPLIPDEEVAHFASRRAALAKLYNRLALIRSTHRLWLSIGPFFHILGKKQA